MPDDSHAGRAGVLISKGLCCTTSCIHRVNAMYCSTFNLYHSRPNSSTYDAWHRLSFFTDKKEAKCVAPTDWSRVLWQAHAAQHVGNRIAAAIPWQHFHHLYAVVGQVVVQCEQAHVPIQRQPVIPVAVKAQHLPTNEFHQTTWSHQVRCFKHQAHVALDRRSPRYRGWGLPCMPQKKGVECGWMAARTCATCKLLHHEMLVGLAHTQSGFDHI